MADASIMMTSGIRPTDLIEEVQRRRNATARAAAAVEHRHRRTTVLHCMAVVATALLLAGAGKATLDHVRVGRALDSARTYVSGETPESLMLAATWLEEGLDVDPDDPDGRTMLAFVRAQQAIDGSVSLDRVRAALEGVSEEPRMTIARGIVAALEGRFDRAQAQLDELEPNEFETDALRRAHSWVQGQVAVHQLGDPARLGAAIEAIDAAQGSAPGWARTHRVAAALCFRAGRLDEARTRLDEALRLHPADSGAMVDLALYDAVTGTQLDGLRTRLHELPERSSMHPRDAARARVAAGLLALRRGDDDAPAQLDDAYRALDPADQMARILALEVVLRHQAWDLASRWVESGDLLEDVAVVHRAWIALGNDELVSSLEALMTRSQSAPHVALVQGLALVEQGRFAEARPRLNRAAVSFPDRPFLQIAIARTEAFLGDPRLAAQQLDALAHRHPDAPRAWTGLAEALVAAENGHVPPSAEPPLRRALERESVPAQAAYLLGLRLRDLSVDDPSRTSDALESLRRAVELRPWASGYRETLGHALAEVGGCDEALTLLLGIADEPYTAPSSLLLLTELAAASREPNLVAQTERWMTLAQTFGAPADALVHTRARVNIEAGMPEHITRALDSLGPWLREHPGDLEARLLHVEALRLSGRLNSARASIRIGSRSSHHLPLGRLMLAWATIERDDGKERRAASLASRGWTMSLREQRPANELLESAELALDAWRAVDHRGSALLVGRQLTHRVPHRAESWILRSRIQQKTDHPVAACYSARRAVSLDPSLPDAHRAEAGCSEVLGEDRGPKNAS